MAAAARRPSLSEPWYNCLAPMIFVIFAPLALIVLRLSVNWRWRTVILTAAGIGLAADVLLDFLIASRL
jgi:hypothetical protein